MLKRVWRKREHFCTLGGNVNWYSHYREQYGGSLKKLKIELPYDPPTPLLGKYPENTIIKKDTSTPMFTVAYYLQQSQHASKLDVHQQIHGLKQTWCIYIHSGSVVKNPPAEVGNTGLVPGLGKGNGNPIQYSCLKNPMDRGVWWVHEVPRIKHDLVTKHHHHIYYTMEYYLVIKKNEIGLFVEMWMDLETVTQNEVREK